MADEYKITNQEQATGINPATKKVDYFWKVSFVDGRTETVGAVMIPVSGYTAEKVRAAIVEQLASIRQVANLTD